MSGRRGPDAFSLALLIAVVLGIAAIVGALIVGASPGGASDAGRHTTSPTPSTASATIQVSLVPVAKESAGGFMSHPDATYHAAAQQVQQSHRGFGSQHGVALYFTANRLMLTVIADTAADADAEARQLLAGARKLSGPDPMPDDPFTQSPYVPHYDG